MAPSAVEVAVPVAKTIDGTNGLRVNDELKSPASPLPEVKIFDAGSATVEDLVDAIRVAGGVVIRNVLNQDELAMMERDIRPELEKDTAWGDGMLSVSGHLITSAPDINVLLGDFFPAETRRAFGLVTKSRTFADRIFGHPLWTGVTDALLSSILKHNWVCS